MNFRFKNYAITHDGLNYVVNAVYMRGEKAKEENQGQEAYKKLKYYSTLKSALKSIRDMVITDGLQGETNIDEALAKIEMLDDEFITLLENRL
jgi:hypothetical protein